MAQIISYAQNKEDLYIASFFPDVKDGFYVDIGAYDPIVDSVTKYFYKLGWSGINVEPQAEQYRKLVKDRRRDTNLKVGISSVEGSLKLREYPGGGFSTFSDDMKKSYADDQKMNKVSYRDYEVEVITLKTLFSKYAQGKHIHFLKVDVEGLEYEVLESNDWTMYRPELICIEANHIVRDWHAMLKKQKYHKVFFDGLNEYFLAEESLGRKDKFNYPEQFLTRGAVAPYEYAWQIKAMKKELKSLYDEKDKLQKIIGDKDKEIYTVRQEYESFKDRRTVKGRVRQGKRVAGRLSRRGSSLLKKEKS